MNLFLTEDGVLKMGYYGLTTLSECYGIKIMNHDGFRRFAPEVSRRQYEVMSDLWYLGVALVETVMSILRLFVDETLPLLRTTFRFLDFRL